MPYVAPVLIDDWYVTPNPTSMGSTHLNPSPEQIHNATKIWNALKAQGYSDAAAAGILGNMQQESGLSPAALDGHLSTLPASGTDLSLLTNEVMLDYCSDRYSGYGTGLIQWDSYNNGQNYPPAGNQIVSFAIRYGYDWYDGDMQMYRLQVEAANERNYWYSSNVNPPMTWAEYKEFTGTPERAADIFRRCRERGGDDSIQIRRDNARYWYDYFGGTPDPPTPPEPTPDPPQPDPDPEPPEPPSDPDWVWGEDFAQMALAYDPDVTGVQIPYSQMDCIEFVDTVWHDISVVSGEPWTLGPGTNSLWRSTATYNTSPPSDPEIYPTPVLWWKGPIDEYTASTGGRMPVGCLLFHKIPEDGSPPIPPQYAGDGIGNFVHVGIYCGDGYVMQSGGQDAGSVPGGGVHKSKYSKSAWNYLALVCWVDPTIDYPISYTFDIVTFLSSWYSTTKKGVNKRVKRIN